MKGAQKNELRRHFFDKSFLTQFSEYFELVTFSIFDNLTKAKRDISHLSQYNLLHFNLIILLPK